MNPASGGQFEIYSISGKNYIDRLLKKNEMRREEQRASPYPMSRNDPRLDSPFERRRLFIMNSLFRAVGRMNGKPSLYGYEARECHVSFYQQHVRMTLDQPKQSTRRGNVTTSTGSSDGKLSLSIHEGTKPGSQGCRRWQEGAISLSLT
jgi:hypothetical protein